MANLQGKDRAAYVQEMFDRIARRYDLMNRLMTFGQDQRWRRFVVKQTNLPPRGSLLDLATGTGDIALIALENAPQAHVVGADFSVGMMLVGKRRPGGAKVRWSAADALNLPFPSDTFDAVTEGYLLRNVIDIPRALAEQLRVLKPGGRVVILDSSPPPKNIFRPFIMIHLKFVIPLLGRIISGNPDAYKYLPESTQKFKTPDELVTLMREAGFVNVTYKMFMFNMIAVHWGEKPR